MATPVQPVGARAVLEWMDTHHTLPYAKALVRYRDGERWWLPENVKEQREIVNARYTCQNELLNE